MPFTTKWYGLQSRQQYSATAADRVDILTDTIKIALVTTAYTPDQDTHAYWAAVNANEVASGSGYTTGGNTLASKTSTYDAATNTQRFDAADPTWTFSILTSFRYAIIYKDTGAAATSPLLGYLDAGATQAINGVFNIQFDNTDGYLRIVTA
jgi:hypothetical protein